MNAKKNYTKGIRRELVRLLSMSGVMTYRSLNAMPWNRQMAGRMIRKMEKEGVLEVYKNPSRILFANHTWQGTGEEYEQALTKEEIRYYRENVSYYMKNLKEDRKKWYQNSERLLRESEINALLYAAGTKILTDEKPCGDERIPEDMEVYYTSREIRRYWEDKATRAGLKSMMSDYMEGGAMHTRGHGLLISPGGNYAVYHTGRTLMKWEPMGEMTFAVNMARFLNRRTGDVQAEQIEDAIMLADVPVVYARMAVCEKKYQKRTGLEAVSQVYRRLYVLTTSSEGRRMACMMQKKGWQTRLREAFLAHEEMRESQFCTTPCDGYDREKDVYTLLFCIPDLIKLKDFATRAALEQKPEQYRVICFTHQLPIVANIVGADTCRVLSIQYETYEERTAEES